MSFRDIRFPPEVSYGASGGAGFKTDIVAVANGNEQRNSTWPRAKGNWDVSHGVKTTAQKDALQAFFYVVMGAAYSFRFKDWTDFSVIAANGALGTGAGAGVPVYQMHKRYAFGGFTYDRPIYKPVSGTVVARRNGATLVVGAGAGQIAIDHSLGTVTIVADASAAATSVTVGTTTTVVSATNPGTLIAGQRLYLSGFTGADAAILNNLAHTINTVTGTGPFTFSLLTNTLGKTITLGSGLLRKFPQATESLDWAGEFDVPCRFQDDKLNVSIDAEGMFSWDRIVVSETRDIT